MQHSPGADIKRRRDGHVVTLKLDATRKQSALAVLFVIFERYSARCWGNFWETLTARASAFWAGFGTSNCDSTLSSPGYHWLQNVTTDFTSFFAPFLSINQ